MPGAFAQSPIIGADTITFTAPGQSVSDNFARLGAYTAGFDATYSGTVTQGLTKYDAGRLLLTGTLDIPHDRFDRDIAVVGGTLAASGDVWGTHGVQFAYDGVLEITDGLFTSEVNGYDFGGGDKDRGVLVTGVVTINALTGSTPFYGAIRLRNGADLTILSPRFTFQSERIDIDGSSTLRLVGPHGVLRPVLVADGATLHADTDANASGDVTGGVWNKNGTGRLSLLGPGSGTSTGVNVNAGTLVASYTTLPSAAHVGAGATLEMSDPTIGYGHSNDGIYAGTISGSGAFVKAGSGILTLTGNHVFTGGTTITGGTLRLGENGSSGMIAGNVVNNGTLIFERSDDVRFAGAISGSGAVVKAGDGVLTLTGEHTFTGGTSITGGSLRIGGGGTSGMIDGDIYNDVYLTFDRSDNARYSGSISGSGSVWKAGAGQLELTGISTHTGQTIVQAGSVIVNGRLTDSYMFVEAGARLGGGGSVNGFTIESGGRVAPGNSVGTLTVLGDVQFDPGSFFDVEIEGDRSDLLRVAGTAGIDGGTINVLGAAGGASSGRYTVLTAGNGVTGRFTAVADDLPDIDFVDVYDGSSVQLVARATANTSTLSAKSNGVAATAGVIETASMFTSMLGGRMSGGPQPSATTAPLAYVSAGRGEAAAAIDDAVAPLHAEPSGLSVFVQGMGGTQSVAGQGAASGLDASMGGVLGGIEYANHVSNTVFGVAGGYSASGVRVTDGSARLGTAHLGLYGSQGLGDLTLSGALGYHWGTIDLSRNIAFGGGGGTTATGSASMQAVTGSLEAFYDVGSQVGAGWSIGPVASLHAANAYRGAYGETGAGILNLQVGADAVTRIDGNIGLRIGGEFDFGGFILTPQMELRYERQLINTAGSGQATIAQAGASFAPQVSTGAQDQLGVGLALGVEFSDNFGVAASYDGSFGQGTQSHRGLATMSLKF